MSAPKWEVDEDGNPAWVTRHNVAWPLEAEDIKNVWTALHGDEGDAAHAALAECVRKAEALDRIRAEVTGWASEAVEWASESVAPAIYSDGFKDGLRAVLELIDDEVAQ